MRNIVMIGLGMLAATPALAMKVTNLDTIPHRVELVTAGTREVRSIAPNATEVFASQPAGVLSLITAAKPQPARGRYQADGVLSGMIGEGRTEGIPADSDNQYVIWPNGKIMLQRRIKDNPGQ